MWCYKMTKFYMWQNGLCITYTLIFNKINQFLISNGWETTDNIAKADYVIIGACASFLPFFDRYKEKIKEVNKYNAKLIVYGCLPIVDPEFYKAHTPNTAMFIPILNPECIETLINNPTVRWKDIHNPSEFRKQDYTNYVPYRKYVYIQEGCSEGCVFCPHKIAIGKEKSSQMQDIIVQIQKAITDGAKIVYIEGNNAGSWGLDLKPKQNYKDIIKEIIKKTKGCDVHIGNFAPKWFLKYWKVLQHPRITEMKIPIQSTSHRLLKLMGRECYVKEMSYGLKTLKKKNNNLVLRTEIIVGLPTETKEELVDTLNFVAEHFDKVAIFNFDFHPKTELASMRFPFIDDVEMEKRVRFATDFFKDKPNTIASVDGGGRICAKITKNNWIANKHTKKH